EEGCTVVLITHDEQIAAQCPRVIKMNDGLIVP
ncbi:macrolide ABC transporter ATP-binding protein, partial [Coxiella burnetii]